ncbi:MAG: hypothetical protein QF785_09705 [Phycisphaeraceae bacterium]|nr:hypothetical protein [Phycisphaeraceae bacterium]
MAPARTCCEATAASIEADFGSYLNRQVGPLISNTIITDDLRRAGRFHEIAECHRKALSWEPQGWIPLGIIVNNPEHLSGLTYDQWLEPRPFYQAAANIFNDTLTVGSDYFPVLSLNHVGDVLIINLSANHIREFAVPHLETVARELGPATLHSCTLPHRRADHVFDAVADSGLISTASNQFGFEYYADHVQELRGRVSIEAFYEDVYSYVTQTFGSFREWACDLVPRFNEASGLVLYMQVSDVEEGRELWPDWEEAHRR